MKHLFVFLLTMMSFTAAQAASKYDNPDTIVVSRDGTGEFRTIAEAVEVCRAFMEYHKVIYIKNGVYKEKIVIPSSLTNIELCGEDCEKTIITYDDHANIIDFAVPGNHKIGTFRTYTLKIEGSDITLKNLTVENNAAKLGQAVALHTEGDRLVFINCRFLGNQDTVYTAAANTRLFFKDCYIEGTTDFIFGPSTAWFEGCEIKSKADSFVTAASTQQGTPYGYIFHNCRLTACDGITKCYLGRPWRQYAHTLFINCEIGAHILPVGWNDWQKDHAAIRYAEYGNTGAGASTAERPDWVKVLTKKEAQKITMAEVFGINNTWNP